MQTDNEIIIFLVITTSIIFLILIVIILAVILIHRNKQLKNSEKIVELRNVHEKAILKTKLEIQEETLEQIAREIHDNIGLSLTLAKLNLNTIYEANGTPSLKKIENSVELISKAITDLSNISRSLNPNLIYHNGLIKTLEDEIEKVNASGHIHFNLQITGETKFLDTQKELLLFRIVQECINNIIKHAGAQEATIAVTFENHHLVMQIEDNGVGLKQAQPGQRLGSGLLNMESRTKIMQGEFKILSSPSGTILNFKIPL